MCQVGGWCSSRPHSVGLSTDFCKLCINFCALYWLSCSNNTNPNLFKYFSKFRPGSDVQEAGRGPGICSHPGHGRDMLPYISCSPTLLLERPRPLFFLLLLLPVTDLYVASGAMFTVHSAYPNEIFHDLPQHTDPCVYMYYNLTRQLFGQRYFQLARSILPITFIN